MREYSWQAPEDVEHSELRKACKARCKQYGKGDCPHPDHFCAECEHDAAVVLHRKHPAPTGGAL